MVAEYFTKKMLVKVGYTFDPKELTDFEVDAYTEIANRLSDLQDDERKKASKRPRRK